MNRTTEERLEELEARAGRVEKALGLAPWSEEERRRIEQAEWLSNDSWLEGWRNDRARKQAAQKATRR